MDKSLLIEIRREIMTKFPLRLRSLRLNHKMTQKEVARGLHIPENTYQTYEQGIRLPKLKKLIAIAKFFNVSTDFLLGLKDE